MKAKISIILLALVAVAFVAVAPVAADLQTVPAGGVVFVGEESLALPSASGTLEYFAPGDTPGVATVPAETYTVTAGKTNVIDKATFQGNTGNWYDSGSYVTPAIVVKMPSIDVKVFDTTSGDDMSNSRVVKSGTSLVFRLDSNLYEGLTPRYAAGDASSIKVVVVDNEGTTYTALVENVATAGTTDLTDLVPTETQYYLPDSTNAKGIGVPNWDLDSDQYKAGVYTFYAQVNLNGLKDNLGTITGVTKSDVKTIELGKDDVKVEANKDTIITNNDFAVTITGRPSTDYALWVKGTSTVLPPFIKANQNGVAGGAAGAYVFDGKNPAKTVAGDVPVAAAPQGGSYQALVTLSSSGTRTVGFGTDTNTDTQTYTIRADLYQNPVPFVAFTPTYDTVKVKVEGGDVTITASGDSSYYIGEEIVLSGTNTDTDDVYLFITGPNLESNGADILNPTLGVVSGGTLTDGSAWVPENVDVDDTWEYKWSTAGVNLDAGAYTIYAVTTDDARNTLSDATYSTASIVIKKPFVTATTSSATVAKGDDLTITGTAEGDPSNLAIWILGKNKFEYETTDVEDDGSFDSDTATDNLASGQYFVVVQHPMENGDLDLIPVIAGTTTVGPPYDEVYNRITAGVEFDISGRQGAEIADALVNAMNSPNIDDTYYKLTFMVEEPWIMIDAIGDKYVGETFSITGTTNLAVGDSLIVETTSAAFKPTEKTQGSGFFGGAGTVLVTAGDNDGVNNWEFAVDASGFVPDQYIVTVEAIEADQTATQTFQVLKAEPTTEPTATPVPTEQPTATPVPTEEPTPEETATPGFGVLVALIGLGAVAALIVRKD